MIDKRTGSSIDEDAHIRQSIATILFTVIGTRVQRREFGSYLFDLIDAPLSLRTQQILIAVIADAIVRWEPRIKMNSTVVEINKDGSATITTRTTLNNELTITESLRQLGRS